MFSAIRAGFRSLQSALSKTRSFLAGGLRRLLGSPPDEQTVQQLERLLYEADFGVRGASSIAEGVTRALRGVASPTVEQWRTALAEQIRPRLPPAGQPLTKRAGEPLIVCVVGVNGNGKTTTLAKLAYAYQQAGWSVILAAADTFRAAAIDQLAIWADRIGCGLIRGPERADPAAVAFDACNAAKARGVDLLLIDTAGRLQNKEDLMAELAKVRRVCCKAIPGAPHETLLVVEATTGQNALDQAAAFHQQTPLTGIVITKMDGTAKGGIAVSLYQQCSVPVRWVGTGEQLEDLALYDPDSYLEGILREEDAGDSPRT